VTVYVIAQLKFTDRAAYDRYRARSIEVFRDHRATVLAADESPEVVEGRWDRDKVVVLSFPDEAAFRRLWESPEYQQISVDRHAGADTVVLLVKGLA
jgi:uncharacterized protein (DUF1330 family)